jgi:hypothetical protein
MDIYCFLAFLIGIAAMIWMVRLILGAHLTDKSVIASWRDLFEAWDAADSVGKYSLVLLLLCLTFFRTGRWGVLAACFAAIACCIGAVCGQQWLPILQQIREMLKDLYQLMRELRVPQPQNAP